MFLPLGETTVIDRIYAELEGLDRIDEAYVSTNERFATDFENHLEDTPYDKPRLSVEETAHEDEKLGVVGALEQLIDREGLDEDLLVIAGTTSSTSPSRISSTISTDGTGRRSPPTTSALGSGQRPTA